MWELAYEEGWVLKNWWFWIVVLEKTLGQKEIKRVNPKRNQSWISLEGLMLKLKLQSFGHLIWRADSLETSLILGTIEGRWRRGWQRMRWLDSITDSMDMNLSKLWEMLKDWGVWYVAVHGVTKNWTQLSYWTTAKLFLNTIHKNLTQNQSYT